ncbi:MAG: M20 family metallopeptidase [Breznakibacter sp.]
MILKDAIRQMSNNLLEEVTSIRHHLHQYPELSFSENQTSLYIRSQLDRLGIPYQSGYAGTGIVARLEGKNPGRMAIALRADMDALPIEENTQVAFKSINKGVMHACGHDAHSASLLGTANILVQLKDQWEGTVLLIFQPGEETFPGGAKLMMEEGALDNPKPVLILGQHVLPDMAAGHVGFKEGIYMASGDEVYLTVKGKGGHAAMPHTLTDTVLAASHIVVALQQIVSRFVPANIPTVLSFGKFVANGATNIIPEKVEIAGTLRTMNEEWRAKIKQKIREIAQATASTMGASCEVTINDGYPMVHNHEGVTQKAIEFANDYLGSTSVERMDIRMTAEDFGYYTQKYPCTFYRFGVKQALGETGALHTPVFNLNDASLETSMGLMAWLAVSFLSE